MTNTKHQTLGEGMSWFGWTWSKIHFLLQQSNPFILYVDVS
jgi:hypothetical protein